MPRYHYNVYDGVQLLNKRGGEPPDLTYARREAIRYAGTLLEDGAQKDNLGSEGRMESVEHNGTFLFRLDFLRNRLACCEQ